MIDWKAEALSISGIIKSDREFFHMHPELGNKEFVTSGYIENCLKDMGIQANRLLDTALTADIKFSDDDICAALRADMDALPITEESGAKFTSLNDGFMHACGHDVHMSAVLGAVRLLMRHKNELKGTLRLIFQPDEEGDGGAKRLVDLGIMEGVDAVFGAHVTPDIEEGKAGIRYGKFYAASDVFTVTVNGKSSHGAEPEKGIDALRAAAMMAVELYKLPEECLPDRCVLTVGQIEAGTAVNIVAGTAVFSGIIRTLGPDNRKHIKDRLRETISHIADVTGVKAHIDLRESYPGVVNSDDITAMAEESIKGLLGDDMAVSIDRPTMTTEDFGYYIDAGRGTFYHFGAGPNAALHSSCFLPGEDVPVIGAAVHAAVISDFLCRK